MAKKMTKTDAKKRLMEIRSKIIALWQNDYVSFKDCEAVIKIVRTRKNQLK